MRTFSAAAAMLVCAASCFAQGYVCAEGGGTGSGAWAAEMYGWMAEKGQKGAAVIIGAVELDAPDKPDSREAALLKAGASSVKSLVVTEKNADTQEVYDAIAGASIVFIRGGSQSRYVEMWKGTKTEAAIRAVFAKGGVVGGTSAGCAILGEMSYDAIHGSLKPEEIVKDARHPDLTLTRGFLGLVPGVLFDTHFGERARLPRLMVMLAHCREDRRMQPLGIGLDPRTALCVSPDGIGEVKGEGYATVLNLTGSTSIGLKSGEPPAITNVSISIVPAGARLDLGKRQILNQRVANEVSLTQWQLKPREVIVPASVVRDDQPRPKTNWVEVQTPKRSPQLWCIENPYAEPNATMTRLHSLVGEPMVAVLMAPGAIASFSSSRIALPAQAPASGPSTIVLDTIHTQERFVPGAFSKPAVYGGLVHLLPSGWEFSLSNGRLSQVPLPSTEGVPPR